MKAELKTAVQATGSHLMDIYGIGPAGAARILADVGDVARFPDRNHFASWTGTAPIDASSGQHIATGCRAPGTPGSTMCSISPASSSSVTTPRAAPATGASSPPGKPRWKRCAVCAAGSPTRSTGTWQPTLWPRKKRAREGTPGRL